MHHTEEGIAGRSYLEPYLEWQDWAKPILVEPFLLENGHLLVPGRPGNGIEWDEDAIKPYRLDVRASEAIHQAFGHGSTPPMPDE